jgi:hypothetical protein
MHTPGNGGRNYDPYPCALRPLERPTAAYRLIGDTTACPDPQFYRPHVLMLRIACLPSHDPGGRLGEALGVIGLRMFRGDLVTIVSALDPHRLCRPGCGSLNYLDASEQAFFQWSATLFLLAVIMPREAWTRARVEPFTLISPCAPVAERGFKGKHISLLLLHAFHHVRFPPFFALSFLCCASLHNEGLYHIIVGTLPFGSHRLP